MAAPSLCRSNVVGMPREKFQIGRHCTSASWDAIPKLRPRARPNCSCRKAILGLPGSSFPMGRHLALASSTPTPCCDHEPGRRSAAARPSEVCRAHSFRSVAEQREHPIDAGKHVRPRARPLCLRHQASSKLPGSLFQSVAIELMRPYGMPETRCDREPGHSSCAVRAMLPLPGSSPFRSVARARVHLMDAGNSLRPRARPAIVRRKAILRSPGSTLFHRSPPISCISKMPPSSCDREPGRFRRVQKTNALLPGSLFQSVATSVLRPYRMPREPLRPPSPATLDIPQGHSIVAGLTLSIGRRRSLASSMPSRQCDREPGHTTEAVRPKIICRAHPLSDRSPKPGCIQRMPTMRCDRDPGQGTDAARLGPNCRDHPFSWSPEEGCTLC
jgi:hypothetical protein